MSGAAGLSTILPASIQRALAIDPRPGSTYLDAEHVVILMQENRSFDHCFGTLQGVRGFNDPRAISLPDKNPVWLQTNAAGQTYTPFRLDIKDTKVTWMGSLPHSRSSQVDAYNNGKYDRWLDAKRSGHKKYADMPLTLGHYTREDLPFNYAMADAFTICDQHFCSAMTSTWPNRLYLWSGTIREQQNGIAKANIRNSDLTYSKATWNTFPEQLEANGISWKVYQNDISCGGGFVGEERAWLANFGCNPLEWFAQYNVKFSDRNVKSLQKLAETLPAEISALKERLSSLSSQNKSYDKLRTEISKKEEVLNSTRTELAKWTQENFEKLSEREKALFRKAFSKNNADPDFREITAFSYDDNGTERKLTVPKGDILYQFRNDVNKGKLPTVSWLVGPANFSDHPSAPWYGSWYVSEILDILTKNPEIWKKTIFILTYDENDGYFDHVPPFIPPDQRDPSTGKCSAGIETEVEHIRRENELQQGIHAKEARDGAIGLGYRVPLIVASPWSRGGKVCSQVFDHTSALQFLEGFLSKKFGKDIRQSTISKWRRTVSGDLTAVFSPFNGEKVTSLPFLKKDPFIAKIHKAQFKKEPNSYRQLSKEDIERIRIEGPSSALLPQQEKGIRPSCALPYELYAEGKLSADRKQFEIKLEAADKLFGTRSAGSPFTVYAGNPYFVKPGQKVQEHRDIWSYAVAAGDSISDSWDIDSFAGKKYHLKVHGPNGFFREYKGDAADPAIEVSCRYEDGSKQAGAIILTIANLNPGRPCTIRIADHITKQTIVRKVEEPASQAGGNQTIALDPGKSFGWYDFSIFAEGYEEFEKRYAGRVETGKEGFTDPVMGRVI